MSLKDVTKFFHFGLPPIKISGYASASKSHFFFGHVTGQYTVYMAKKKCPVPAFSQPMELFESFQTT